MQTESLTESRTALGLNPNGLLSLAMTAFRFSAPEKSTSKNEYITLEEVSWHDNEKDCWVVIYDRVYDITKFLEKHPGGMEVLLEHAGRDATIAFRGAGHTISADSVLRRYFIAELPPNERIFRTPGGIRCSGIPT